MAPLHCWSQKESPKLMAITMQGLEMTLPDLCRQMDRGAAGSGPREHRN